MKIWTLMENTVCREDLAFEHGLSLYIETAKHKILFDAGQSGAFADNAEKMGIDLSEVDIAVLSHGHYDHGGGLSRFLEINKTASVYMNEHAFEGHYHGEERYIGIDLALKAHLQSDGGNKTDSQNIKSQGRIILVPDKFVIDDELTLYSCNDRELVCPIDSSGLTVVQNPENTEATETPGTSALQDASEKAQGLRVIPEDFRHEQYLMITESLESNAQSQSDITSKTVGRVLISGCSHKGILNIANWFAPDVLVGGFHFMNLDPENESDRARLNQAAKTLSSYDTKYLTCHCTGLSQYAYLKEIMGEKLAYISGGQYVEL